MVTDFSKLPATALIRLPDVIEVCGTPRATIYFKIAAGQFPPPIKLSARCVAWRWCEIQAWLANPTAWRENRAA